MNKFWVILKKELKDLMTMQTLIPIIVMALMFMLISGVMKNITGSGTFTSDELYVDESSDASDTEDDIPPPEVISKNNIVGLIDNDKTEMSARTIRMLKQLQVMVITPTSTYPAEAMKELQEYKLANGQILPINNLIVLEKGFGEKLEQKNAGPAEIKLYGYINSFGLMSMISGSSVSGYLSSLQSVLSNQFITEAIGGSVADMTFLQKPIDINNYTVLNNNVENVTPSTIQGYISSQTVFIPIIIFLVVFYASQSLASSITNEKSDKTLETLMTTPVSRLTVLMAKMLAAAITAIFITIIFMISLKFYMDSMNGSGGDIDKNFTQMLKNFGISFNISTYLVVGVQLLLSVMCGLTIAMIIGVLAEDIKSLQGMIMPLLGLVMVPYLLSMFIDINTLPWVFRCIAYAIPFTHTFIATTSMFTQRYGVVIFGMIYQLVFVAALMFIAIKIFSSDKLFTLSTLLKPKPKKVR